MAQLCTICGDGAVEGVKLGAKGAKSLNAAAVERKSSVRAEIGSTVHEICRKRFTDKKDIALKRKSEHDDTENETIARSKRQRLQVEERHNICLFCTHEVDFSHGDASKVETHDFGRTILECCEDRADEWAYAVRGKINFYGGDLPARDCVYHHSCSINFRNGKDIPRKYKISSGDSKRSGRPENEARYQAFREACDTLDW